MKQVYGRMDRLQIGVFANGPAGGTASVLHLDDPATQSHLTLTGTLVRDASGQVVGGSGFLNNFSFGLRTSAGSAEINSTDQSVFSLEDLSRWIATNDTEAFLRAVLAGGDVIEVASRDALVFGFDGADQLIGGGGADTLYGGAGNDFVRGARYPAGPDPDGSGYLRGDEGDDKVAGGGGFDDINGNMGSDTCSGAGGDDWVVGGKDDDLLFGDLVDSRVNPGSSDTASRGGNDIVYGNLGNDTCYGDGGADTVRGGQGDDRVFGGDGADFVSGDLGADTLAGGAGADVFHSFLGAGLDLVTDFAAAQGDRVRLLAGTSYTLGQSGADTVIDMGGDSRMVLQGVQLSSLPTGWLVVG